MANIDLNDINKTIKDSAYVAVGLGVLGFQRAQVRRHELVEAIDAQRKQVAGSLSSLGNLSPRNPLGSLADQRKAVTERLEIQRQQVAGLWKSQQDQAGAARAQVRDLAKSVDERFAPARRQFEQRVDHFEQRLPAPARSAFQTVRTAAAMPEAALRTAVGLA